MPLGKLLKKKKYKKLLKQMPADTPFWQNKKTKYLTILTHSPPLAHSDYTVKSNIYISAKITMSQYLGSESILNFV